MTIGAEQKKIHDDLRNVGLRAQGTAAGLVQLCKELQLAGVIGETAVGRIKDAIADEITLIGPRTVVRETYRQEVCSYLDSIFSGAQKVGRAEAMPFASENAE